MSRYFNNVTSRLYCVSFEKAANQVGIEPAAASLRAAFVPNYTNKRLWKCNFALHNYDSYAPPQPILSKRYIILLHKLL